MEISRTYLANNIELGLGLECQPHAFDHRRGLEVLELGLELVVLYISKHFLLPVRQADFQVNHRAADSRERVNAQRRLSKI